MATLNGGSLPSFKVEDASSMMIKDEPMDDALSPYMEDDIYEDAGDLDFTNAQKRVWLSHIPQTLWDTLSTLDGDDEIEIGTLRVEGPEEQPSRISLKLHRNNPQLRSHPQEYNLRPSDRDTSTSKRSGQAFVFSQKDSQKTFGAAFHDEDGTGLQGRSILHERNRRERQRKENKDKGKKFEPYGNKPVTKQTAIAGIVEKNLDCVPVKNEEFYVLEAQETLDMLKIPDRPQAIFGHTGNRQGAYLLNQEEKRKLTKASQAKKQAIKDGRTARVSRGDLIDRLLLCFKRHRIWGLRDLKAEVNQPEVYVRETLQEIAFMWKSGDFNGKWELKNEFKAQDAQLLNPTNSDVAPEADISEFDASGKDEDDDDEKMPFEDV